MRNELRELAESLPVPAGDWHPFAAVIRAVRDELLEQLEDVDEDRLAELLAGPLPAPCAGTALALLPVPEGQHPFLDEIRPFLEAARLVQAASLRA